MDTETISFWSSGVWVIPLVLAVTIAILVWATRSLRQSCQLALKQGRSQMIRILQRRTQAAAAAAEHTVADDEPYITRMSQLQEELKKLEGLVNLLDRSLSRAQEAGFRLERRRGLEILGAPFAWWGLMQQAAQLQKEIVALEPAVIKVEQASQRVQRVAWDTALAARAARGMQLQVKGQLEILSGRNLGGQAFEAALQAVEDLGVKLNKIPAGFYEAGEAGVLGQASKAAVVRVHAIAVPAGKQLDTLAAQVGAWTAQVKAAFEGVGQAVQHVAGSAHALAEMQGRLELSTQKKAQENLEVIAQNLQATLGRMEVESLDALVAEGRRVERAASDLEGQVRQAGQALAALESGANALRGRVQNLSVEFASQGAHLLRPVAWGRSGAMLTNVTRQVKELASGRRLLSPEQVAQEYSRLQRLETQVAELEVACQTVAGQHAELANLLNDPLLADWREWLTGVDRAMERMLAYSPENWPRQDNVVDLPGDLESLALRLESLAGSDRSLAVEEAELAQVLAETQQMLQAYHLLRERANAVQAHFLEMESDEKRVLEQLEHTRRLWQQLAILAKSSSSLAQIMGNEAGRVRSDLETAANAINQRERGMLEKKLRQAETLIGRVDSAAGGWLARLSAGIEEHNRAISAAIAALDGIAQLDEPALSNARRLLGEGPSFAGRPSGAGAGLEALFPEIKRRCDYGERLAAGRQELEDIAGQVIANHTAANQNRQSAKAHFEEVSDLIRRSRGWPPISISFQAERQELANLEQQWDGLKQQRLRGIPLAAQLGNLSARYQALVERTQQALERATEDQIQVTDLENDYGERVQRWQTLARTYSANELTQREIQDLLANSERDMNSIRQACRQGTRNYIQTLQGLRNLVRNIDIAIVAVDESHSLNINGQVTRAK